MSGSRPIPIVRSEVPLWKPAQHPWDPGGGGPGIYNTPRTDATDATFGGRLPRGGGDDQRTSVRQRISGVLERLDLIFFINAVKLTLPLKFNS
jgi:hypothetical protein